MNVPANDQQIVAQYPAILAFSEDQISRAHGTGAMFLRTFSRYPAEKLFNIYIGRGDTEDRISAFDLNTARWPQRFSARMHALPFRVWNGLAHLIRKPFLVLTLPVDRQNVKAAVASLRWEADLVYAICYSAEGLVVLSAVLDALPERTPLVMMFHDFWPSGNLSFRPLLRALGPRISSARAVSRPIAQLVSENIGKSCTLEPQLQIECPSVHKHTHRPLDRGFTVVLLGNVWKAALFADLLAVWAICRSRLPFLGPVHWYCHPAGVKLMREAGLVLEPLVEDKGFLAEQDLISALADADLAIIPFSRGPNPADDYERYSMPSKVTELAAVGLPIFALTGPATPLADYLQSNGIGEFAPSENPTAAADYLLSLMNDTARREHLGVRGRLLAERDMALAPYQSRFYDELSAVAASNGFR